MTLIPIGTRFDGDELLLDFPGAEASALVAGVTGSGKSKLLECVLGGVAYRADVAMIVIDLKRIGFRKWKPRLTRFVTTPNQSTDVLWQIAQTIKLRMEIMEELDLDEWDPTLGPYLLVVIDELAELAATDDGPLMAWLDSDRTKQAPSMTSGGGKIRLALLSSIARLCRAFGIRLWCATQYPVAEIVPTELRSNLAIRFGHKVTGNEQVDVAMGEGFGKLIPASSIAFDEKGVSYALGSHDCPTPTRCRSYLITDQDARQRAADTAFLRWAPELVLPDLPTHKPKPENEAVNSQDHEKKPKRRRKRKTTNKTTNISDDDLAAAADDLNEIADNTNNPN